MNASPTVRCKHCGKPTPMLGTEQCDSCWEERRSGKFAALEAENAALRAEVERQKNIVVGMRKLNSKVIAERDALREVLREIHTYWSVRLPKDLMDRARALLEGK
jgi:hypothetical protein